MRDLAVMDNARRELQAILGSGVFAPSSREALLLSYLFGKMVEGRAADVKEYTIAVDVFNKPSDFDSHSDPTVRVAAHRLRKKLQRYYQTAGRASGLRAVLPAGQYVLEFQVVSPENARPPDAATDGVPLPPKSRSRLRWLAALVAGIALLLGFTWFVYPRLVGRSPAIVKPAAPPKQLGDLPDPEPAAVRILVGRTEPYVDNAGRRWQPDRFFEGGIVRDVNHEIASRTSRPELFRRVREGTSTYRVPLPPGEYALYAYLAYPDAPAIELGPDRQFRIMSINVNGRSLDIFDLAAEVGSNAEIRAYGHLTPDRDGILEVLFKSARGPAAVSAIEILPMTGGKLRPVRIIAQRRSYLDVRGRLWLPDDYYSGGRFGDFPASINGQNSGIVSLDREGDFEYFIPVPAGAYQVTLYFGEAYHGPGLAGGGGVGSRVFDVLLNNEMALRDFDMLRDGPPLRLVTRTFHGVRPDKRGKIHLSFSPKKHLASVRAIEVLPEN